jgi:hypothetical protein
MREPTTFDPTLILTGADLVDVAMLAIFLGMVWLIAFLPHRHPE